MAISIFENFIKISCPFNSCLKALFFIKLCWGASSVTLYDARFIMALIPKYVLVPVSNRTLFLQGRWRGDIRKFSVGILNCHVSDFVTPHHSLSQKWQGVKSTSHLKLLSLLPLKIDGFFFFRFFLSFFYICMCHIKLRK